MKMLTVALSFLALPAFAQFNNKAFDDRAVQNKITCDAMARDLRAKNPGQAANLQQRQWDKCMQGLGQKQHDTTAKSCAKFAAELKTPDKPERVVNRRCMNAHGFEAAQ